MFALVPVPMPAVILGVLAAAVGMLGRGVFVLPKGGSVGEDPLHWGNDVLDAATWYRVGNYLLILSGMLLLGFLGAVHARLRQADPSGALATIAVGAGTLLSLLWPLAAVLHDVALDIAGTGADVRMLAGWDSVAPYSLALSALPRLFFVVAIVAGLRRAGGARWLRWTGIVLLPLSLLGSAELGSPRRRHRSRPRQPGPVRRPSIHAPCPRGRASMMIPRIHRQTNAPLRGVRRRSRRERFEE